MKKMIISAAIVAAFVAAGTIAYCTSEKNHEKDLVQANYEALLDGEQPNTVECVWDPQYVCVALHPTDPNQDKERPYSRWWYPGN